MLNKPRLTTFQQQRPYEGGKRYPDLRGVKGVEGGWQVRCEIQGLDLGPGFESVILE